MGELYKLAFPNGKCYIGITTVGVARRYQSHKDAVRKGRQTKLYNAWRKHGAPVMTVLAVLEDSELAAAEARAVAAYDSFGPRGYNSTPGGDVSPMLTPGVVAKMKLAMQTPEARARSSEARKGKAASSCARANMSAAHKGKTHSKETRSKMSAAHKGKLLSPETRARISAANKGRVVSMETREKLRAASLRFYSLVDLQNEIALL
jgi:group I intron endonuclease